MRWLRRVCLLGLVVVGLAAVVYWQLPDPGLYPAGLSYSRIVEDAAGRPVHLTLAADERYRLRTNLDEVSQHLIDATLFQEDHRFYDHPGVDVISLGRATVGMITGTKLGGGSTITMQLARLRFGLETTTIAGKLVQIFHALQLERHYTKDQILEVMSTRLRQAIQLSERTGVRLVFTLLSNPWVHEAARWACANLPEEVAVVMGERRWFGELPVMEWGQIT